MCIYGCTYLSPSAAQDSELGISLVNHTIHVMGEGKTLKI